MNCNRSVDVQYIGDIPVDTLESLPDFILSERDILEPSTGNTIRSITRTPAAKLFPNGNMDNIFGLEANNEAIIIPENQVRAVRVVNEGSMNVMHFADATHAASMIAVGSTANAILCQCSGVINLPMGHSYIIGAQYYTGADGEPVTDSTSGQKLFIPVSNTKLVINM